MTSYEPMQNLGSISPPHTRMNAPHVVISNAQPQVHGLRRGSTASMVSIHGLQSAFVGSPRVITDPMLSQPENRMPVSPDPTLSMSSPSIRAESVESMASRTMSATPTPHTQAPTPVVSHDAAALLESLRSKGPQHELISSLAEDDVQKYLHAVRRGERIGITPQVQVAEPISSTDRQTPVAQTLRHPSTRASVTTPMEAPPPYSENKDDVGHLASALNLTHPSCQVDSNPTRSLSPENTAFSSSSSVPRNGRGVSPVSSPPTGQHHQQVHVHNTINVTHASPAPAPFHSTSPVASSLAQQLLTATSEEEAIGLLRRLRAHYPQHSPRGMASQLLSNQDPTPRFFPDTSKGDARSKYPQHLSSSLPSSPHQRAHAEPSNITLSQLEIDTPHSPPAGYQRPVHQKLYSQSPVPTSPGQRPHTTHIPRSSSRSRNSHRVRDDHSSESRSSQRSNCSCHDDHRRERSRPSRRETRPTHSSPSRSAVQAGDFRASPMPARSAYTSFAHNRNTSDSDSVSKRLPVATDLAYASFADLMLAKPRGPDDSAPSSTASFAVPTVLPSSRRNSKSISEFRRNSKSLSEFRSTKMDFSTSTMGFLQRSRNNSVSRMTDDGGVTPAVAAAPAAAAMTSAAAASSGLERRASSSLLMDDAARLFQLSQHYRRSPSLSYRSTQVRIRRHQDI